MKVTLGLQLLLLVSIIVPCAGSNEGDVSLIFLHGKIQAAQMEATTSKEELGGGGAWANPALGGP